MYLWLTAVKTRGELCIPQNGHLAFQIFWTTEIVLGGRRNGGVSPCCWTSLFWTPCFKQDWCGGSSWRWAGRSTFIKTRLKFALDHQYQAGELWRPLFQPEDSQIELFGRCFGVERCGIIRLVEKMLRFQRIIYTNLPPLRQKTHTVLLKTTFLLQEEK